jgi:hypothetical protein
MRHDQLAALARLASTKKDADLADLAGVSARLAAALRARDAIEAALAEEIALATLAPEVPLLQALDAHVVLAEKARTSLEAKIQRIEREREGQRLLCARSFGRADVISRLRDTLLQNRRRSG